MSASKLITSAVNIHIIGLGVAAAAPLDTPALAALQRSGAVIGSERQLQTLAAALTPEQQQYPLPKLSQLPALIEKIGAQPNVSSVAILASGDPLYFGIGRWFSQNFSRQALHFYPAVSSIQAACHALGLSLQDVDVISLHGRAQVTIRRQLQAGRTLVLLTDKNSQPQKLAQECQHAGFPESRLWVCEKMGYAEQKVREFSVAELLDTDSTNAPHFDSLQVTVITVMGAGCYLPRFPGIPDTDFITDGESGKGLLTKREVRLTILSLLQPGPSDIGWDIGAGCGSVAVEWGYWAPKSQVFAIEHHRERFACMQANCERFGVVNNVTAINARAPAALAVIPAANKIFIGGSDGELPSLLNLCWQQLPAGGVLVASAVTENTKMILQQFYANLQDCAERKTLQVAVSRGGELAGQLLYRPNLPVSLFQFNKPFNKTAQVEGQS